MPHSNRRITKALLRRGIKIQAKTRSRKRSALHGRKDWAGKTKVRKKD